MPLLEIPIRKICVALRSEDQNTQGGPKTGFVIPVYMYVDIYKRSIY